MTGKGAWQFELRLVNGLQGDPAVYVFFPITGRSLLFDLGVIDNLSNREVLKARDIFVSHTHIDHFIGFDRLLRVNIPHGRKLTLAGPDGFIANVEAKIKGYTWNLLDPGQLQFEVHEIHRDGRVLTAEISNDNGFVPVLTQREAPSSGVALVREYEDGSSMSAISLDHGTPSIAYRYQAPQRFHVDSEAIQRRGWSPGPWISELQTAVTYQRYDDIVTVSDVPWRVEDLAAEILIEAKPFAIGYLTDISFDRPNLERIRKLMTGVSLVVSESNFCSAERDRAFEKKHLTTRQAALIAASVGAERLQVFHISSIYGKDPSQAVREAESFFAEFRALSAADLAATIEDELA